MHSLLRNAICLVPGKVLRISDKSQVTANLEKTMVSGISGRLLIFCYLFMASPCFAISLDVRNPSFELLERGTNFPLEWEHIGSASSAPGFNSSATPPTHGRFVGHIVVNSFLGVGRSELEHFLALPIGHLDTLGEGSVRNGSALSQIVALRAGRSLAFDFDFGLFNFGIEDQFGFFSISQQLTPGIFFDSHVIVLADADSDLMIPSGGSFPETGFRAFSHQIDETAIYKIGFGVARASDRGEQSAIRIDSIRVVPEPGTISLIFTSLVFCCAVRSLAGRRSFLGTCLSARWLNS